MTTVYGLRCWVSHSSAATLVACCLERFYYHQDFIVVGLIWLGFCDSWASSLQFPFHTDQRGIFMWHLTFLWPMLWHRRAGVNTQCSGIAVLRVHAASSEQLNGTMHIWDDVVPQGSHVVVVVNVEFLPRWDPKHAQDRCSNACPSP